MLKGKAPPKEQLVRNCAMCGKRVDIKDVRIMYCSKECRNRFNNTKKRSYQQGMGADINWEAVKAEATDVKGSKREEQLAKNIATLDALEIDPTKGLQYRAWELEQAGFCFEIYSRRYLICNTVDSYLLQYQHYAICCLGYDQLLIMKLKPL